MTPPPPPHKSKFKVVICGGGIGGLMTAVALSKYHDIEVAVYEAAAQFSEIGAGVGIFPRPWGIIRKFGLEDELLKACMQKPRKGPVTSFRYRKSDQKVGFDFYNLVTNGSVILMHRADFQTALLGRLPESCKTFCGKRVQSYTQPQTAAAGGGDGSGPIEVLFEDGSTEFCDVLVGADGIKSAVRRSVVHEQVQRATNESESESEVEKWMSCSEPVWSGTCAYRSLVPAEKLREVAPDHPALDFPSQYIGKDRHIITYPICHGRFVNFAALTTRADLENTPFEGPWTTTTDKEEFSKMFEEWEEEVQLLFKSVEKPIRWAIHTVRSLPSFVSGRAVLIGDAAHAMLPHQGSGAGQAIEDAYMLATLLGHPKTTLSTLDRALSIYDRVRRPRALDVVERSRLNGLRFSLVGIDLERRNSNNNDDDVEGEEESGKKEEMLRVLRELGEEIRKGWEWTWSTEVDVDVEEAVGLLEG